METVGVASEDADLVLKSQETGTGVLDAIFEVEHEEADTGTDDDNLVVMVVETHTGDDASTVDAKPEKETETGTGVTIANLDIETGNRTEPANLISMSDETGPSKEDAILVVKPEGIGAGS